MDILVLDGKEYIKASKAAKDLGYTSDYIGQLCRNKSISAHLVGRTWYVNTAELHAHKVDKKRISRVKAREQAKKSIAEYKEKINQKTQNNYKNIVIQYESDTASLIPETRKILVKSDVPKKASSKTVIPEEADDFTIEHEGEKVQMSGEIEVIDVTETPIDTELTLLKPRIIKTEAKRVSDTKEMSGQDNSYNIPVVHEEFVDSVITKSSLPNITNTNINHHNQKKVLSMSDLSQKSEAYQDTDVSNTRVTKKAKSILPYLFFSIIIIFLSVVGTSTIFVITYSYDTPTQTKVGYQILFKETYDKIKQNI